MHSNVFAKAGNLAENNFPKILSALSSHWIEYLQVIQNNTYLKRFLFLGGLKIR
jgi:hypothetical protein